MRRYSARAKDKPLAGDGDPPRLYMKQDISRNHEWVLDKDGQRTGGSWHERIVEYWRIEANGTTAEDEHFLALPYCVSACSVKSKASCKLSVVVISSRNDPYICAQAYSSGDPPADYQLREAGVVDRYARFLGVRAAGDPGQGHSYPGMEYTYDYEIDHCPCPPSSIAQAGKRPASTVGTVYVNPGQGPRALSFLDFQPSIRHATDVKSMSDSRVDVLRLNAVSVATRPRE